MGTGSKLRRFLEGHLNRAGLAVRRLLGCLALLVDPLGLEDLDHLADLVHRLVLGVPPVRVVQKVLSVPGMRCCEFRLDLVDLVVLVHLAVHRFRLVQGVRVGLVVLVRLLGLGFLVVHPVRVVQLVRPVLVVLVVQLGTSGKRCLVVGMEQQLLLGLHRYRDRLVRLVVLGLRQVLEVLVVLVDSLAQMECIGSALADRRWPDASDGRCC